MNQRIEKYVQELHEFGVSHEAVEQSERIFEAVPEIKDELCNPTVDISRKHTIADTVFPSEVRDFLKLICDDDDADLITSVFAQYRIKKPVSAGKMRAVVKYVTAPNDAQRNGILRFLSKKYNAEIDLVMIEDKSLISGFIISVGNDEYDWSSAGRLKQYKEQIENLHPGKGESIDGIISLLKSKTEDFELEAKIREVGFVKWVGDGIVRVDGMDHVMYGEIVIFDDGTKGMVQEIRRNEIGCILFGSDDNIAEGTRVVRTGKNAGIPVGDGFLGRAVNALGAPIDGGGEIKAENYRPIENPAPGIAERKSVSVPMETGILSIDSMFPIGRGQRELIIGDRQTGKTSIAVDAILNQKGKDVVCIYVAIGQKTSTVAKVINTLKKHGAMDYSVVLSASASEPASLQYIAPYSGTSLAEYFMYKGRDVLIVYDDLSKHAVAYRAISLLLERSPGREAYPGDVFYLHSRLLERSCNLRDDLGGSITALPIIETQAGDVSAYIPTNVISITDGQIFLESSLFFSGMRPAVNVGLSVSRVGGAAQTKAMKKAAGSLRIDLAQYREMEIFTQFSSDLDDNTKRQLAYGKGLMELLKQPLCSPLPRWEQVVTLCAATHKAFMPVPISEMTDFRRELADEFVTHHHDIIDEIEATNSLSDSLSERIVKAAENFCKEKYQQPSADKD